MNLFTTPIDKGIPVPLYYQLKNIIKLDIENGTLPVGTAIPTENEIASYYQLSRSTVRQALLALTNEGYLTRKASKGTFVTEPTSKSGFIRSFEPFYQQVAKTGKKPRTELINLNVIQPSKQIQRYLGLKDDEKVISLFRRRYADDIPTVTIQNYIPYTLCPFILSYDFTQNSLYEILMSRNESKIKNTKSIVSSELATTEDSRLLNIEVNAPMLCFHNISITANGTVVDYAFARYRGDENKFEIDVSPD